MSSIAGPMGRAAVRRIGSSLTCWCFFFQAEDGIRDHCVTGVQTCALPILERAINMYLDGSWKDIITSPHAQSQSQPQDVAGWLNKENQTARERRSTGSGTRSEERRVGKECRARWSANE